MLSCAAAIFHSSPTSNTSVETVLIIFNMSTFFLSSCFLFWHGYSSMRFFTIFNRKLTKRFHRVKLVFLGICIVYVDKIYNIFKSLAIL